MKHRTVKSDEMSTYLACSLRREYLKCPTSAKWTVFYHWGKYLVAKMHIPFQWKGCVTNPEGAERNNK